MIPVLFQDASKKVRIERWENVIRVLNALTPHARRKHFDMGIWIGKTECGTVGCAAGLCGIDPWFNRRGFKIQWSGPGEELFAGFSHLDPWDFFGNEGTQRIFKNTERRPVSQVVREIKAYIKELEEVRVNN